MAILIQVGADGNPLRTTDGNIARCAYRQAFACGDDTYDPDEPLNRWADACATTAGDFRSDGFTCFYWGSDVTSCLPEDAVIYEDGNVFSCYASCDDCINDNPTNCPGPPVPCDSAEGEQIGFGVVGVTPCVVLGCNINSSNYTQIPPMNVSGLAVVIPAPGTAEMTTWLFPGSYGTHYTAPTSACAGGPTLAMGTVRVRFTLGVDVGGGISGGDIRGDFVDATVSFSFGDIFRFEFACDGDNKVSPTTGNLIDCTTGIGEDGTLFLSLIP